MRGGFEWYLHPQLIASPKVKNKIKMRLRADVFLALPIPVVPPLPIPDQITPIYSPTTATLIHTEHEAVLVDALTTTAQAHALADWIEDLVPNKRLTHIYITHGHGDHFFGLSTLKRRFPGARAVATEKVRKAVEAGISSDVLDFWRSWFPGDQIEFPTSPVVTALDAQDPVIELEGHVLRAVDDAHSDTDLTSFLWVEDLKMAVAGDIVYNGAYQYLAESLTASRRQEWIHAVRRIQSFRPETVVVGHQRPGAVLGSWALDATVEFIEMWGELVEEARDAEDLFRKVRRRDPGKVGEFILWWSCLQQFPVNGTAVV